METFKPLRLVACEDCGEVVREGMTLLHKCPAELLKAIKDLKNARAKEIKGDS